MDRTKYRKLWTPCRVLPGVLSLAAVGAAGALPLAAAMALAAQGTASAQGAAQGTAAAARQTGTIKSVTDHDLVLTDSNGQDHAVDVPAGARVLIVPPGSKDLSAATAGTISDLQTGDRAIVSGKAGETGPAMTAVRIVVMKSSAIAQTRASQEAAWTAGVGGLVKSVDPSTGSILLTSAAKTVTVSTGANTLFRRYAGGSVRFEDATRSSLAAVAPGDQLRARGTRSADGSALTAEEVVTGSFKNYSGEISSVDAATNTVTLKDLATKKPVTVSLSAQSNIKRLPPELAARFAARERAGSAAGGAGARTAGAGQAGAGAAGSGAAGAGASGAGAAGASGEMVRGGARGAGGPSGLGGGTRGGGDLSAMIGRLPSETLGGLKVGEAVMIVASSGEGAMGKPTAITLLAGVEPILSASPGGEGMTLSPWSVGGAGGEGEAAAGPQ